MTLQKNKCAAFKILSNCFLTIPMTLLFADTSCNINLFDKYNGWVLKIAPALTVIVFSLQLEINQIFV